MLESMMITARNLTDEESDPDHAGIKGPVDQCSPRPYRPVT